MKNRIKKTRKTHKNETIKPIIITKSYLRLKEFLYLHKKGYTILNCYVYNVPQRFIIPIKRVDGCVFVK